MHKNNQEHAPVDCPNCRATVTAAFCGACGQPRVASLNPTLGEFLHDLVHEILHVDGKIFRSLKLLLTRPGFLTREHFFGRRAAYVADIVPTSAHLDDAWIMGFDLFPVETLGAKQSLATRAMEDDTLIFFPHDPAIPAGYLTELDGKRGLRQTT